jgi:hypothetical protein
LRKHRTENFIIVYDIIKQIYSPSCFKLSSGKHDDEVFRSMLSQIIEDGDLGEVIGEADDGAFIEDRTENFIIVYDIIKQIYSPSCFKLSSGKQTINLHPLLFV